MFGPCLSLLYVVLGEKTPLRVQFHGSRELRGATFAKRCNSVHNVAYIMYFISIISCLKYFCDLSIHCVLVLNIFVFYSNIFVNVLAVQRHRSQFIGQTTKRHNTAFTDISFLTLYKGIQWKISFLLYNSLDFSINDIYL